MIKIEKKREPRALNEYRKNPDASYNGMHGAPTWNNSGTDVYHTVLESLMSEQGHLCAYCMRKIPEKKGFPNATIEHIEPQSKAPEKTLDYKNMLAVCSGNRNANSRDWKTCDARRENEALSLNPLKSDTISDINYRSTGVIYSDNPDVDRELNEVLNLNCQVRDLVYGRKAALGRMHKMINEKGWSGNVEMYKRLLMQYQEKQENKEQYVGIMINWLKKHT